MHLSVCLSTSSLKLVSRLDFILRVEVFGDGREIHGLIPSVSHVWIGITPPPNSFLFQKLDVLFVHFAIYC